MPNRIEDYAVIGNCETVALVGRDGSIDWLCLPRFDSAACFARLLGDESNGYWRIAPLGPDGSMAMSTRRRYREGTLVLETEFETPTGSMRLSDCMPIREAHPQIVRVVDVLEGTLTVRMELSLRFGYGQIIPWVTQHDGLVSATAGPDSIGLWTRAETKGQDLLTVAEVTLTAGQQLPFSLTYYVSHELCPRPMDPSFALTTTANWWRA